MIRSIAIVVVTCAATTIAVADTRVSYFPVTANSGAHDVAPAPDGSVYYTGQAKWKFHQYDVTDSGILTTATDLLFTGGREGYFHALDARTGGVLWKVSLGGQIVNGPITYAVDGKQYVTIISGNALFTFALRE